MKRKHKILLGVGLAGLTITIIAIRRYNKKDNSQPSTAIKLSPSAFKAKYYPIAKQDELKTGVPALFTLAQAAIESGYGQFAYGNNFFGIKTGPNWKGSFQELRTWESGKTGIPVKDGITDSIIAIYPPGDPAGIFKNSYSYRVRSKFRRYPTALEGFIDHSNFLRTNSRYKEAFNYKNDPYKFAYQVAKAGYATDPNYSTTLSNAIKYLSAISGGVLNNDYHSVLYNEMQVLNAA